MRKMFRTLVFGVIIATPLLLAPHKSQAGIIKDVLNTLFGSNKDKKSTTPTNSVPLNEGEIFLIVAGLGLGAKILYDRHRKQTINSVI